MTTLNLFNIYQLLSIVDSYNKKEILSTEYIRSSFNNQPRNSANLINSFALEDLCKKLNFIELSLETISITPFGIKFIQYYEENNSNKLNQFIIDHIISIDLVSEPIFNIFSNSYAYDEHIIAYPKEHIYDLFNYKFIVPILYEINFFTKINDLVLLDIKYINHKSSTNYQITQNQLDRINANKRLIGTIAEDIVLAYEKTRLIKAGYYLESTLVKQISNEFANAGYDIESYAKNSNGHLVKIYIEVKGTIRSKFGFYWSSNEVEKAEELGERYRIYFISKINPVKRTSSEKPIIIINPFNHIFNKNSLYTYETSNFHIGKKSDSS